MNTNDSKNTRQTPFWLWIILALAAFIHSAAFVLSMILLVFNTAYKSIANFLNLAKPMRYLGIVSALWAAAFIAGGIIPGDKNRRRFCWSMLIISALVLAIASALALAFSAAIQPRL